MSSTPGGPRGSSGDDTRSGRHKTDESLRAERVSVDRVLEEKDRQDRASDSVTEQSRAHADRGLELARDKVDVRLDRAASTHEASQAVGAERALEDAIVRRERDDADRRLHRERRIFAASLVAMIPGERGQTDRLLTQERARSDDEVANRDDFLGIVSHDLRTLLGVISLNATALVMKLSDAGPQDPTRTYAQRIQRASTRMDRLVTDLLDVVSIDAGKLALRIGPCNPSALLSDITDLFRPAAQARKIALDLGGGSLPAAWGADGDRVQQVLSNLISNALKFTGEGGRVVVGSGAVDDRLQFFVEDTGKGIPADMLGRIFERFWQVGADSQRGLGLGLYISRCVVEAHGGEIWAESTVDRGSCFRFTLPDRAQAGV